MTFLGFEEEDFNVFTIDGLEPRMEALIEQLRPKLNEFGKDLAHELTLLTGQEMFAHVAKHARRKTNPPNDSWVAFASNKRGYKMLPHFQIGLWSTHVFVQWGLIYECTMKDQFAKQMLKKRKHIMELIPPDYIWLKDHMNPEGIVHREMTTPQFNDLAKRLEENKNGELMVGIYIPREEALQLNKDEFYFSVLSTWKVLNELHQMCLR